MSAHAPSGNSAPYKLLGVYGQPVETTIDFVLPNRRTETIRCGDKWFSQPHHGNAGHWLNLPHRRGGSVECFLSCALCTADCKIFRRKIRPSGSGHDDRAGRGIETQPQSDAHRRCRQACQVVLRAETGAPRKECEAPARRAGGAALAELVPIQSPTVSSEGSPAATESASILKHSASSRKLFSQRSRSSGCSAAKV